MAGLFLSALASLLPRVVAWVEMAVLLLGGNGLLGHNVLKLLLQRGYEVHALLRNPVAIHTVGFPHLESLSIFKGSILSDDDLSRAALGCDAIINCAGTTDMSLLHYEDYLPVNRDLCGRLLQLMERQHITRLVHTSTANTIGYGSPTCPATEQESAQPPFSDSFYGRSKREGECCLQEGASCHPEGHIVIVNPGFMVGAYDTKPSSGALLLAAYRKPVMLVPKGGKSFVHVADVAVAIVNALIMGIHGNRYLVTGENLTLRQFYQLQAHVCGYRQRLLSVPNWLLFIVGFLGDVLRRCGVATQVCTRNVRQLMVCEYYDATAAHAELQLPTTSITQAISDFFCWNSSR